MIEFGHKMKEEMKAIQSEIKEMYREPTVKGRKSVLKSMVWSRRKKQEFKTNQERLRKLQDNFKHSNI